jgi:hypothetical protein
MILPLNYGICNRPHNEVSLHVLPNPTAAVRVIPQPASFRLWWHGQGRTIQAGCLGKAATVTMLAAILRLSPLLAITLGRVFRFVWPGFRAA